MNRCEINTLRDYGQIARLLEDAAEKAANLHNDRLLTAINRVEVLVSRIREKELTKIYNENQ